MSHSAQFPATGSGPDRQILTTALAGAIAMSVAMGLGRFFYTPVLPAMMAGLGLGPTEAGWIASANYAGYLLGAVLAAYGWAEGIERKVALTGLVSTALLLLAMGMSSDSHRSRRHPLSCRARQCLRHGFHLRNRLVPRACLRQALGPVDAFWRRRFRHFHLCRHVRPDHSCRQRLAHGLDHGGGAGFAGLAVVSRYLPRDVVRIGPAKKEPPLVWTRELLALTLAYGIFGFGYIVTATFLVAIVRDGGGSSLFEAGVWLVTGLAAAPSVAYWMPAVRRVGLVNVFALGCLVEALGVAASVLLPLPAGPVIGGVLLGATFIMVTAFGLQAGRQLAAQSPRRALALMTAAFGTGQILGPVVAGYLADWSGSYTWASLAAAAGLLASGAIVLVFCRPRPA
jgi:MFS family permease